MLIPVPVALVVTDQHHDDLIWRKRPEITGDAFFALSQVVSLAIEHKLPIIFGGDNVECMPTDAPVSRTIHVLRKELSRLADAGLNGYFIQGQHDDKYDWITAVSDCVVNVDGQSFEIGGVKFAFMSYRRTPDLPPAIAAVDPTADVLICHQVFKELFGGSSSQMSVREFVEPKLLISGDLHQFKQVRCKRKDREDLIVVSPGATHARKLTEPAEHYVVVVHDDLSVKKIKLRSRIRLTSSITDAEDFDQLYEFLPQSIERAYQLAAEKQLPAALQTPIFALVDTSDVPQVEYRVQQLLQGSAHLFYDPPALAVAKLPGRQGSTFDSKFDIPVIDFAVEEADGDQEVIDLFTVGLSSENLKNAIDDWHESFMKKLKVQDVA